MRILHIAYYTFKRNFKDCIPQMIVLPLVLILILGYSLKLLYNPSGYDGVLAVYSRDAKDIKAIESFVEKNKNIKDEMKIVKVEQKEKAIELLKKNQCDGVIDIESKKSMKIYIKRANTLDTSLVKSFVKAYNFSGNKIINDRNIKNIAVSAERKRNSTDYYSITMLVMIILYGAEYGADNISDDKKMIDKTVSLPMREEDIIVGKNLGTVTMMFIVATIIIVFSKFIYKAYWGNNYISLMLMIILFSLFSVNLGSAICLMFKDRGTASYIIEILIVISTFVGGGYVNTFLFSDKLKRMSILSPSYAEQSMLFKIIYRYKENVGMFYLEIIILTLLVFGITVFLGRRRKNDCIHI